MGFVRHGQRADVNLTDMVNDLVALRYIGVATNITFELPDEGTVTRTVTRAQLWTFLPDGTKAEYLGETLVFPQIIDRELRDRPADWHLGVIRKATQKGDTSRSVYTLEAPENADSVFGRMESELIRSGQS